MFSKIINKSEKIPQDVRPALCLDLDGTIRFSPSSKYIQHAEDIELFAGVEKKIWEYKNKGYLIFGVTNQGGVAYDHKTPEGNLAEIAYTRSLFSKDPFDSVKYCYHMEEGSVFPFSYRSLMRKPFTGMLTLLEVEAWNEGYVIDWDKSVFVGDNEVDKGCAEKAGLKFEWAKDFFEFEA
jgi:D-glycero-D-manno-heptose 1,7-bisphosphate phosphatase